MTHLDDCPCKDCIILSICQNKTYVELTQSCELVMNHLYYHYVAINGDRRRDFSRKVNDIVNYMKPYQWKIKILDNGFADILVRGKHYAR